MDFSMEGNKQALLSIQLLLEQKLGIKKNDMKPDVWKKAIAKRISIIHIADMQEYYELLLRSSEELQAFIELLIIPETWFFREKEIYPCLVDYMRSSRKTCRFLSIPCSSGEEPYSIVIAFLMAGIPLDSYKIDAIDISHQTIAKARTGRFEEYSFRGLTLDFRLQYFDYDPLTSAYVIRKEIRDQVTFMQGNIFDESCNKTLELYDVILCRNLLIYLNSNARQELLKILQRQLLPNGILIVSPAEIQIAIREGFTPRNKTKLFVLSKPEPGLPTPTLKTTTSPSKHRLQSEIQQPTILQDAIHLADQGLLEKAEHLCKIYIKDYGANAEAYFILGTIEHARNMSSNAEQYFFKVIHLNPNHYETLIYLALIAESRGDTLGGSEFRDRAKKAVMIASVNPTKLKGLFHD
jgi:chemotaxis protein methyltransferase WspC